MMLRLNLLLILFVYAVASVAANSSAQNCLPNSPDKTKSCVAKLVDPEAITHKSGWDCSAEKNNATWNCQQSNNPKQADLIAKDKTESEPIVEAKTKTESEPIVEVKTESNPATKDKIESEPVVEVGAKAETTIQQKRQQIFKLIESDLQYNPWASCKAPTKQNFVFAVDSASRKQSTIDIQADQSEVFDQEVTTFLGNVEMTRADQVINSDVATYSSLSEAIDMQGNVYYRENNLSVFSDTALLKLPTDQVRLRNAQFVLPMTRGRGTAEVFYREGTSLSHAKQVSYTTCRPGNQGWVIHSSRLKINQTVGRMSAKNAWIAIKGMPVFYSPYLSFPIDNRRHSGLLSPSFNFSGDNGIDFSSPYYWNIAPNYDITIKPRMVAKRGFILGGNFRYFSRRGKSEFKGELLTHDRHKKDKKYNEKGKIIPRQNERYSRTRGQFAWKSQWQFTPNLITFSDINYISDKNYIDDLDNVLNFSSESYVSSHAGFLYQFNEDNKLMAYVQKHQVVDDKGISDENNSTSSTSDENNSTTSYYKRLPIVILDLNKSFDRATIPINLSMQNEYVHFRKHKGVIGHRLGLKPSISMSFSVAGGGAFIKPKISVQHNQYWDTRGNNPDTKKYYKTGRYEPLVKDKLGKYKPSNVQRYTPVTKKYDTKLLRDPKGTYYLKPSEEYTTKYNFGTLHKTIPIFSLDSGVAFEKDIALFSKPYIHTFEPRLFYLYVPYKKQDKLPIFDTTANDFSMGQLFRENRFSGGDRVSEANQISLGIASRLIDPASGQELLKLELGQIFYFRTRHKMEGLRLFDKKPAYDAKGELVEVDIYEDQHLTFEDKDKYSDLIVGLNGKLTDELSFLLSSQWRPAAHNHITQGNASIRYRTQQRLFNLSYRYRLKGRERSYDSKGTLTGTEKLSSSKRTKNSKYLDTSILWPIYGDWNFVGHWMYSFTDGLTINSLMGVENETCCWRLRFLTRHYIDDIEKDDHKWGFFVQLELKGLTSIGEKIESTLKRYISGYRTPD